MKHKTNNTFDDMQLEENNQLWCCNGTLPVEALLMFQLCL